MKALEKFIEQKNHWNSFFKELHTVQLIAGCMGGALFLVWSLRVANKQQTIVNVTGVTITLIGLYKALG